MFRSSIIALLSLSTFCHCVHQPGHNLGPQKYEIEEDSSKQNALPYHRTILAPNPAYNQNQLNQYYQQYQQNQQQQNVAQPQAQAQAQAHQYLAALQQFYAASKQPQAAYSSAPAQTQAQVQPQYAPQSAASQQYPQPLGVLYSAASDVSNHQFSGNGVNYSFF